MMNGKYLLDTNIVIALFGEDEKVLKKIKEAQEIYHPAIAIGELYYGAFHSSRMFENLSTIDEYRNDVAILSSDDHTARFYGEIKAGLKKKGKPIPENDIWISAIAIQYDLTLVTRDKHFETIDGLKIERW